MLPKVLHRKPEFRGKLFVVWPSQAQTIHMSPLYMLTAFIEHSPHEEFLPLCASHDGQSHQQADGRQANVELLVLKAEATGYIHYNLEARARHGGEEVRHHQLQALKGCSDQRLAGEEQDMCRSQVSFL